MSDLRDSNSRPSGSKIRRKSQTFYRPLLTGADILKTALSWATFGLRTPKDLRLNRRVAFGSFGWELWVAQFVRTTLFCGTRGWATLTDSGPAKIWKPSFAPEANQFVSATVQNGMARRNFVPTM
jgi:hypothetical protein